MRDGDVAQAPAKQAQSPEFKPNTTHTKKRINKI
jgi:hypothetical protein